MGGWRIGWEGGWGIGRWVREDEGLGDGGGRMKDWMGDGRMEDGGLGDGEGGLDGRKDGGLGDE